MVRFSFTMCHVCNRLIRVINVHGSLIYSCNSAVIVYPKDRPVILLLPVTISYPAVFSTMFGIDCGGVGWVGVSLGWSITPGVEEASPRSGVARCVTRLVNQPHRGWVPSDRHATGRLSSYLGFFSLSTSVEIMYSCLWRSEDVWFDILIGITL